MKQPNANKNRRNLENKMETVFRKEIQPLQVELRKILVDDLVTTFESRICVLNKAQSKFEFLNVIEEEEEIETQ